MPRGLAARMLAAGLLAALAACGGSGDAPAPAPSATASAGPQTAAMRAQAEAAARMHAAMGTTHPDPDIAFMQGMIPHHRGAVEMAEIELRHGKDPEARALARAVIAAQRAEIEQMERWLARRGVPAAAAGEHAEHGR